MSWPPPGPLVGKDGPAIWVPKSVAAPRDPVADLIALVERGAFIQGRQHPTLLVDLECALHVALHR
jgi:hypothetical protein